MYTGTAFAMLLFIGKKFLEALKPNTTKGKKGKKIFTTRKEKSMPLGVRLVNE